jgi:hypothetical protein
MKTLLILVSLLSIGLMGCTGVNVFPLAARSGDTITIPVGSPDGMNKANTEVFFTDALGAQHTLQIRSIVKLRPDQTSNARLFDDRIYVLAAYNTHDSWLSVIIVDLPLGLPEGAGTVQISTTADYGQYQPDANNLQIGLNILQGTGASNPLEYYFGGVNITDLAALEPASQIVFRPPGGLVNFDFGAIEFRVNAQLRTVAGDVLPDRSMAIIAGGDDKARIIDFHLQMMWDRNGDEFRVMYTSPKFPMSHMFTRFSIVVDDTIGAFIETNPAPSILEVTYYDIDGIVTTGPPKEDYTVSVELNS